MRPHRASSVGTRPTMAPLSEYVQVAGTYVRAASVLSDSTLPPYRASAKNVALLAMIQASTEAKTSERAWALIGPYGAGKTSFARLLLGVLADRDRDWVDAAVHSIASVDEALANAVAAPTTRGAFAGAAVLGHAHDLVRPLIQALATTLAEVAPRSAARREARRLAADPKLLTAPDAIELVRKSLTTIERAGRRGLVLVVDEFGRFLDADVEHATQALSLIQDLAELANRQTSPQLHVLVLLHQNFEQYAAGLTRTRRNDWAKVQGRFRQFTFQENPDGLYEAIANSFASSPKIGSQVSEWAQQMAAALERAEPGRGHGWQDLLARTYPLHPLTLQALPRLSGIVGQNERSLYAFLSSDEPRGLRAFLRDREVDPDGALPTMRVDSLFDYFLRGPVSGVMSPRVRRAVARAAVVMEQLDDVVGLPGQVVKAIAVLELAGLPDLAVAPPTIAFATGSSERDVAVVLEELRAQGLVLARPRTGSYVLNPGTEADIDELVADAIADLDPEADIADAVAAAVRVRPVVARRHSFEWGTTRSFEQRLVTASRLDHPRSPTTWRTINEQPDGTVSYVLASDRIEIEAAEAHAQSCGDPLHIYVVPKRPVRINELARECLALQRLLDSPGIDVVARAELALRLHEVETALRMALTPLLEPDGALWFVADMCIAPQSHREVQSLLSTACDTAFSQTVRIQNELVNRRKLSSAVVLAVKTILTSLLRGERTPSLGLSGNRPSVSIFRTLLEESGIYRSHPRTATLRRPAPGRWRRIWDEIEDHLKASEFEPRSLSELWDRLAGRPFGLRAGVLPVLTWCVLIAHRDRVCLFENGTYLPTWAVQHYDRMVRFPENFTVRSVVARGSVARLVSSLHSAIPGAERNVSISHAPMNAFLSDLFGWYRELTDYARRTRSLSPEAQALRAAFTSAQDPIDLATIAIPRALGTPPVGSQYGRRATEATVDRFRRALTEIDSAYDDLMSDTLKIQADCMRVDATVCAVRRRYAELARATKDYRVSERAAVLRLRGADDLLSDAEWAESVAAGVAGQAPRHWTDANRELCEQQLPLLLAELREAAEATARLGRTSATGNDASRLLLQTRSATRIDRVVFSDDIRLSADARRLAEQASGLRTDERFALAVTLLKEDSGGAE